MRHTDPHGRLGTTPPCSGAPGFLLLGLFGLPVLLFALITWQVVVDGPLLRVDERVSRALVRPDRVSELLADLGNAEVAIPVLVAALGYAAWWARRMGRDRWWLPGAAVAVLMALVPVLVVPLKELTRRAGTSVMPPGIGYYPSGHTATATIAYGAAALLLLPRLRTVPARRTVVVTAVVLNLGVGFGLVRRGYHWPLDVVASWCLFMVPLTGLALFLRRGSHSGAQHR